MTLAAQIGVLPLSLYYFHQFPGLFIISNLIIIPTLSIILSLGIVIIALSYFDILLELFVDIFRFIISRMNNYIEWISSQESFLFKNISFDILQVAMCYILIFLTYRFLKSVNTKNFTFGLVGLVLVQASFLYSILEAKQDRFIVFNKNRHTVIGIQNDSRLKLYHNLKDNIESEHLVTNYKVGSRIDTVKSDSLEYVYQFKEHNVLVIDSLSFYNVSSFKPDYVLLRNSPKLNLNRLIDSLQPKQIIADASNYKSYVSRWKATCRYKKIPFHSTYEKGVFIID